jgi:hypothetical protein
VSGTGWPAPPGGFVARPSGASVLYAAARVEGAVLSRGLSAAPGWVTALREGAHASGRSATTVVEGVEGTRWRLKSMRRGGALAILWRDRYPSAARLVATLTATVEARERGVPTPATVAMLVVRGPGFLARGFMATEEIEASEDLARRVLRGAVTAADLVATMTAVRAMHDRGVVHPDLNLGNVMLRQRGERPPDASFVDFDRAWFLDGPAPFALRQAAIRRLERSCAKLTGRPGALGPGSEDLWYTLYAGGDAALDAGLARGRPLGRLALGLHRIGWRRNRA